MFLPGNGTVGARSASFALASIEVITMPLLPLPTSNTPRFRVHYDNNGLDHSFQMRSSQSPAAIGAAANSFLTALSTLLSLITITFVEFAPAGSDIFNPVVTGIEGNTYGAGVPTIVQQTTAVNFVGRTTGGRRLRIAVFGVLGFAQNWRAVAGEVPAVDAAIAQLIAKPLEFRGIDNLVPVWKTYANIKAWDHWVDQVR